MFINESTTLDALEQELARVQEERRRLEAEEAQLVAIIAAEEEKWQADYGS
jgi:hypothetical protein